MLNQTLGSYINSGRFKHNYSLIGQIERSAGSMMDNIAEGFERSGNRAFLQFLYIAKGSCGEFRLQLYRALDSKYIEQQEFDEIFALAKEVRVLLQKLINYLEQTELKGQKFKSRELSIGAITGEHVN